MRRYLQWYLIFLSLSFVLSTFFLFGLFPELNKLWFIIIREGLAWGLILFAIFRYWKTTKIFLKRIRISIAILLGLTIYALVSSFIQNIWISQIIVGLKYDLYYLWLLVGWVVAGIVIMQQFNTQTRKKILRFMAILLPSILLGGVILQGAKHLFPDFFINFFGYGDLWDFVPRAEPPIYYLTWPSGTPRFSGLFVGPNVLGFFLVLFATRIIYQIKKYSKTRARVTAILLIVFSAITFSRGAIWALLLEVLVLIVFIKNKRRKKIWLAIVALVIGWGLIRSINLFKTGSNTDRGLGLKTTFSHISQQRITGYGLGMSGPSLHYTENYAQDQSEPLALLENIFLQTRTDLGAIGLILLLWFLFLRAVWSYYFRRQTKSTSFLILSIALAALFVEGMVLHVFIDSMVNHLFFILYGLTVWNALIDKTWSSSS